VAAIADQVFKQIEDLGLNGHKGVAAAELAPSGVEDVTIENKNQLLARKGGFALPRLCLPVCARDISPVPRERKSRPCQGNIKIGSKRGCGASGIATRTQDGVNFQCWPDGFQPMLSNLLNGSVAGTKTTLSRRWAAKNTVIRAKAWA
jgi:hypothetical protein